MTEYPLPLGRIYDLHPSRASRELAGFALRPAMARKLRTPHFEIDLLDRCVRYHDGEEVRFTPRQWRLLASLACASPRAVSRATLGVQLFGADVSDDDFDPGSLGQLRSADFETMARQDRRFQSQGCLHKNHLH